MVKQSSKKSNPFIETRYFIKASQSVCAVIVSGEKEYHSWLHANGTTSCDCDGHAEYGKTCKHIKLLVASEAHAQHHYSAKRSAFLFACHAADAITAKADSHYGSDGLGNSKEAWKTRLKDEKQRAKGNAERYTAKLHLVKSTLVKSEVA